MSAVKVIFKRSSLLGKRPTGQNLEAGEIALNTNSNDPGLFFEVNDGSVAKVGPTAYLSGEPTGAPSLGELWVDRDTKALSIGTDLKTWQAVGTPLPRWHRRSNRLCRTGVPERNGLSCQRRANRAVHHSQPCGS